MTRKVNNGLSGLTLGGILTNHAINYPEDLAVVDVDGGARYTYREFNNRVNRLANGLLCRGVGRGDLLSIYLSDRVEWTEIVYAASKIGAVWVPCNCRFTAREVQIQLEHCQPKWFFLGSDSLSVIETLASTVSSIERFVVLSDREVEGVTRYESLLEDSSDDEPVLTEPVTSNDLAGIIYTSGTTGVPKGVMHTHGTLLAWVFHNIHEGGLVREDRILNPYPMFHIGGLVVSTTAILAGAANFMLGKFEPVKFLDLLEKERLTIFLAAPSIIHAVNHLPQEVKDRYGLGSVRCSFTSGAPLFAETKEAFMKQWSHLQLITVYSSTEMFFSTLRHRDQTRKQVCVGRPAFGSEIKIMDKAGRELPRTQAGLVYGRGISQFIGYYNNPEANQKSFLGEWFTCEDIGYLDEEGYLFLVDRDKDMIISGGAYIASAEVENLLLKHPAIFECAVIGLRDEQWGAIVKAVVSMRPGQETTPEEIMNWCQGKLAGYKCPRQVEIIPVLPKNPVGKILKRELRDETNRK